MEGLCNIFQETFIIRLNQLLNQDYLDILKKEALYLKKKYSKKYEAISHSKYFHVKPFVFNKYKSFHKDKKWKLIEFYRSKQLRNIIEKIVGEKLYVLPLESDEKFEINCKLNYYHFSNESSEQGKIGWHIDKTNQYKGKVYIAVLTLKNDIPLKSDLSTYDFSLPILSYLDYKFPWTERGLFLAENSLTIHDPSKIIHCVNPITFTNKAFQNFQRENKTNSLPERISFVMKFTTNPEPLSLIENIYETVSFAVHSALLYVKVYKTIFFYCIAIVLIIIVFILFFRFKKNVKF
jgi:ACT domain-containing protein